MINVYFEYNISYIVTWFNYYTIHFIFLYVILCPLTSRVKDKIGYVIFSKGITEKTNEEIMRSTKLMVTEDIKPYHTIPSNK